MQTLNDNGLRRVNESTPIRLPPSRGRRIAASITTHHGVEIMKTHGHLGGWARPVGLALGLFAVLAGSQDLHAQDADMVAFTTEAEFDAAPTSLEEAVLPGVMNERGAVALMQDARAAQAARPDTIDRAGRRATRRIQAQARRAEFEAQREEERGLWAEVDERWGAFLQENPDLSERLAEVREQRAARVGPRGQVRRDRAQTAQRRGPRGQRTAEASRGPRGPQSFQRSGGRRGGAYFRGAPGPRGRDAVRAQRGPQARRG